MSVEYPLFYITINVTYSCNLSCKFCYNSTHKIERTELSTEELKKLIDDASGLGLKTILFTGGEPLLRKDIFELFKYCKSKGIYVCLATNGFLINDSVLEKLKNCVDKINVGSGSIDTEHLDAPINIKTKEKLSMLKSVTQNVTLNFTVHSGNKHTLEYFADFCKEIGIELNLKRFIPAGIGNDSKFSLNNNEHDEILKKVGQLKDAGYRISFKSDPIYDVQERDTQKYGGCLAGIATLSINPYGDIILCTKLDKPLGNIRELQLVDFWSKSEVLKDLRERNIGGKCGHCRYLTSCGGCRAASYAHSGDILGEDPICRISG